MAPKFLVIWYDGNNERATLVNDESSSFPYGVVPSMVNDDCELINAIVQVPDNFSETTVVINDDDCTIEMLIA